MYKISEHNMMLFEELIRVEETPKDAPLVRTFPDLIQSFWSMFLRGTQPNFLTTLGHQWSEPILREAADLTEVKTAIKRIDQDEWAAMVVTQKVCRELYKVLPFFDRLIDDSKRLRDRIDGLLDFEMQGVVVRLPMAKATSALDQLKASDPAYRAAVIQSMPAIREAIRKAIAAAIQYIDQMESAEDLIGGGGWTRAGTTTGLASPADIKKREVLAQKLGSIRHVLEMAGRMMSVARRAQSRKSSSPTTVVGFEYGNDPERVLIEELALDGPEMEALFWYKYANRQLIQYKLEGKDPIAKGPIVALVDETGSMKSGGREEWAKAVALVLLSVSRKQKRDFILGGFNTRITRELVVKAGEPVDQDEMIGWLSANTASGGTDFEVPLSWGLDRVDGDFPKADVIFITDGKAAISEAWTEKFLSRKARLDTRLISIGLECRPGVLNRVSDQLVEVSNLSEPAPEVVFSI